MDTSVKPRIGRPPLPITPDRVALLNERAEKKKREWARLAREKRKAQLAAKAIAEGREPFRPGGYKRFTDEELRQHQRERDARRDKEKVRASSRASMARLYKQDPKRFSRRSREREIWLKENQPEVFRLSGMARRAAHRVRKQGGISERGLTVIVRRVWEASGGKCAACPATDRLELDHIIALIRGGTNAEDNLQFLCRGCNASKNDRDWDEWLAERASLMEIPS